MMMMMMVIDDSSRENFQSIGFALNTDNHEQPYVIKRTLQLMIHPIGRKTYLNEVKG